MIVLLVSILAAPLMFTGDEADEAISRAETAVYSLVEITPTLNGIFYTATTNAACRQGLPSCTPTAVPTQSPTATPTQIVPATPTQDDPLISGTPTEEIARPQITFISIISQNLITYSCPGASFVACLKLPASRWITPGQIVTASEATPICANTGTYLRIKLSNNIWAAWKEVRTNYRYMRISGINEQEFETRYCQ
jgi:hypothetical protein